MKGGRTLHCHHCGKLNNRQRMRCIKCGGMLPRKWYGMKKNHRWPNFKLFALPLIRRVFPQLIAEQIVSVQPMMAPRTVPRRFKDFLENRHRGFFFFTDNFNRSDSRTGGNW